MAGFREGLVRERGREEGEEGGGKDVQKTREGRTKARLSTIEQLVLDSKCRIVYPQS